MENSPVISAQVILKPHAKITARLIMQELERGGFMVGDLVGNNFAITASASSFTNYFGARLKMNKDGTVESVAGNPVSLELPLANLPMPVQQGIETILFMKPPDYF